MLINSLYYFIVNSFPLYGFVYLFICSETFELFPVGFFAIINKAKNVHVQVFI